MATVSYNMLCLSSFQTETRQAELETNLSTNLVRRKQELEAVKFSAEPELFHNEAEVKRQELRDAKKLVDEVTQQLKSKIHCLPVSSLSVT